MKTPYGLRGVICERFGWTLHYLEHKIPWLDVHFMMIDAPQFIPSKNPEKSKEEESDKAKPKSKKGKLMDYLQGFNQ